MDNSKLLDLLDEAVYVAGQISGGYSGIFVGADQFHAALKKAVTSLRLGDHTVLDELWLYFAPTCDWDAFVGIDGMHLGNEIFEMIDTFKNSRTFSSK